MTPVFGGSPARPRGVGQKVSDMADDLQPVAHVVVLRRAAFGTNLRPFFIGPAQQPAIDFRALYPREESPGEIVPLHQANELRLVDRVSVALVGASPCENKFARLGPVFRLARQRITISKG